jgi:hypothetical protein
VILAMGGPLLVEGHDAVKLMMDSGFGTQIAIS